MSWTNPFRRFARRRGPGAPAAAGTLNCRELVELVTDYLEGELSAEYRRRFDVHLKGCDGCRTYLDQMRKTILALAGTANSALDPTMNERLLDAFREWKEQGHE